MDMNLQKYLSFVKTVEYGSFTKAAEILHYSQSGDFQRAAYAAVCQGTGGRL